MKKKLLFSLTFLLFFTFSSWSQEQTTVKGKVLDENGEGLPGANVYVEQNTTIGTRTDLEGNFTLKVPKGSIIIIAAVGYDNQKFSANSVPDTIQLSNSLGEVFVDGYRDVAKIKSVSSTTTVSSKTIEQVPVATFDQILQGQAPGLLVQSGSGRPGAAASVLIRGVNSINASTDPLYVIDGVQINAQDFATLNPNDFASVSILKDASATSIYGSRGANGVIVITTKRGKAGKTQFNYRFMYGRSIAPEYRAYRPLTSNEVIDFEQEFDLGLTIPLSDDRIDNELRNTNTDWFDAFLQEGSTWTHEVNASGGSEKFRYFVSGSYFQQEGVVKRTGLDRYTLRINLDAGAPTDNFRFGTSISLGYSQTETLPLEGAANLRNPFIIGVLQKPYLPIFDPDGLNGYFVDILGDGTTNPDPLADAFNPVEARDARITENDEIKLITSVYAEYDVPKVDGLTVRTQWGVDYRSRTFVDIIEPISIDGLGFDGGDFNNGTGGWLTRTWNRRVRFNGNTSISYRRLLDTDGNHEISASVFNEIFYQNFESFNFRGFGLGRIFEVPTAINEQVGPPQIGGGLTENSLISFFGNVAYSYKEKYNVEVGLRRDGSSRFGRNNRFATFFSVGANWVMTEEDFMNDIGFLDLLKLRVSYGTAGNQEVGDFQDLELYDATTVFNGGPTLSPGIGNPDLQWETNNQFNLGIDYAILGNKVRGSIDYYNNLTTDLFLNTQLSRTTGFSTIQLNVGEMRNAGIELSVNADVLKLDVGGSKLTWNVSANYTYNQNTIEKLFNGQELEVGTFILREGEPWGSHFFVERAGVDPSTGEYLWYDVNGNVTNEFNEDADRVTGHGVSQPPHFGGFTNTFTYKGISLSVFFSYAAGNTRLDNDRFFFENPGGFLGSFNQTDPLLDMWRNPGDVTTVAGFAQTRRFDSGYIKDASFLRLRNIVLSYNLPKTILDKAGLRSLRVFAQGQNILTFTNWAGLDPENSSNVGIGDYPSLIQWTIGADIGF